MPRGSVPEENYLSQGDLPVSAETGARATPSDFGGPQRAAIAESIGNIGDKLMRGAADVEDLRLMGQHIQSQQWTSKSMTGARNDIDQFMADPKNYSDPEYAKNLSKMFEEKHQDVLKDAPTAAAGRLFTEEFNGYQQSRMDSAFKTQTEQTIVRSQQDFINSFAGLVENYRTNRLNPNVDANEDFMKNYLDMHSRIDQMFGKIAPNVAHELRLELTTQSAYGVVDTNPELAEQVLNKGVLEGRTRHFLEDAIDNARNARTASGMQQLEDGVSNHLAMVEAGKTTEKLPLSYYQQFLPKDRAEAYKMKVDDKIDIYSDVKTFSDKVSPWSLNEQQNELQKLQEKIGTDPNKAEHDSKVFELAARRVAENERFMHEDPTAYLVSNNPTIKSAAQALRDDKSGDPGKFKNFVNLMLKYQGAPPPQGTPNEDSRQYMNLPLGEIHIMTKDQSEGLVKKIAGSGPKQAADLLSQTLDQYEPQNRGIVFHDLMDKGLSGEMWAAQSHRDAPWIDEFMGAIMNSKELRKDSTDKMSDFVKAIDTDGSWLQWSKVTAADNFQRQEIVNDVHSSVLTYALGLAQKNNMKPEAATRLAIDRLVNEDHVTAHVNGAPVYFNKDSVKGNSADISRRLTMLLSTVDPRQVAQVSQDGRYLFPFTQLAGNEMTKYQAIRDTITQRGEFKVNPDGRSVSLYMNGGEVRDVNNKPFTIQMNDLPQFTKIVHAPGQRSVAPKDIEMPITPEKTYPLLGTQFVARGRPSVLTTNWPSSAVWGNHSQMWTSRDTSGEYTFDGDTFRDTSGTTHRLMGLDAPEVPHLQYGRSGQFMGMDASNYVANVVNNHPVTVTNSGSKDKYGRSLSYVSYKDSSGKTHDLNLELIEKGLAQTDDVKDFSHARKAEYEAAEDRARKSKLGMWASK